MIKKYFYFALVMLMAVLTGCKQEELVFEYEKIHFDTKPNAILLEVVVPSSTTTSDELYVVGAFNAQKTTADFMLSKHDETNIKYGIYLYPEDFQDGKTLADGFTFYNSKQGFEQLKDSALHVIENAQLGERYIITLSRWAGLNEPTDEGFPKIEHAGQDIVYVCDNAGWGAMTLYMWGDVNNLDRDGGESAGWPGLAADGEFDYEGAHWYYFLMGAANEGKNENMIFNNNGGGNQTDNINVTFATGAEYYYIVNADLTVEEYNPNAQPTEKFPEVAHEGQDIVFAADGAAWGAMTLYMWGDVNNLDRDGGEGAGWPGLAADGEFDFKGLHWYYFLMGAANNGKNENMIFNNNGGGNQTPDVNVTLAEGNVYYYLINADKTVTTIEDPLTYEFGGGDQPGDDPEPEPEPEPTTPDSATITLYVIDATQTLTANGETLSVYAWGARECFGGWPGADIREWSQVTFFNQDMYTYAIDCVVGESFNLIINNKKDDLGSSQYDALAVTATGVKTIYYLKVGDDKTTELVPTPKGLAPKH